MTVRILNNHAVIQTDPAQLQVIFPEIKVAEVRGQTYCAVPHTLEAARVLNNLGFKVPSPIRTQYEWPGRYKPRWYQIDTAEFFTLSARCHCHNAPRTGKTLASLWAADYLRLAGKIKRTLIVAPLSTLWDVWQKDIFESFPFRTFNVIYGSREKRLALLAQPCDFYIVNHHGVKIIEDALKDRPDIDLVIVDEVATFRSAKSRRKKDGSGGGVLWAPMNEVLNNQKIHRACWGLTGTPTPNDPTDAFGQCKLITPEKYHGHFTSFKQETMLQVAQFKWVQKHGAEKSVARILNPSIRFERTVCTDMMPCFIDRRAQLSADQTRAYKKLVDEAAVEVRGSTITAVNAATLLSKLVQTACISHHTDVLSSRGWVPIHMVKDSDTLWDGVEWVAHKGLINKGLKQVILCGGIKLTPDHEMLTTTGWATAKEIEDGYASKRFNWPNVRLPDSTTTRRVDTREGEVRNLAVRMHLWKHSSTKEPEPQITFSDKSKALRMQSRGVGNDPWHDEYPTILHLVRYAGKVRLRKVKGLGEVWWQGYHCLRRVAKRLQDLLGRYARRLQEGTFPGAHRQLQGIQQRELYVGHDATTIEQSAYQRTNKHPRRGNDNSSGCEKIPDKTNHSPQKIEARVASTRSANCTAGSAEQVLVYDIRDCGPRNRFVVRGAAGEIRIVHNCGVAYASDGSLVKFDFGPRLAILEELIEENNEKVLVFVPFTGALNALASELRKRWSVEIVDGSVTATKRNKIFQEFRVTKDPHILVCHPQVMAHGLDLTTASLSIWYAPFTKAEIYQQANARTDGSRQTVKMDIAHIYATAEEKRMYEVLKHRGKFQDIVLELSKNNK